MQYKLEDLASNFDYGLNAAAKNYDGINKYLRITDIDEDTRIFKTNDIKSPSGKLEGKNSYLLSQNDIVFARTGASVGKTYLYNCSDGKVYFAGYLIRIRVNKFNSSEFIFYNTLTAKYQNFVQITSVRSGQPGINSEEYKKYKINIPNLDEQKLIGNLLIRLDEIIALEQEKLNYLYSLKIFLLENLLTSKEKLPSIRFNNYNNLWRKYKLSNLGNTISGVGFPIKEQKGLKGIPFYKVSDMNNIGNEAEMNQANNYVSEEQISENKWNPIDKLPSIIFAKVGAALMLNRKRYVNHKFLIDNNMMAFSVNQNNNGKFIKHVFDTMYLPRYAQVGALPSLNGKDINNISIFLPSKEEQNKIVNILNLIDKLINNSQQKLNNMRTAKEYLLNNLFA